MNFKYQEFNEELESQMPQANRADEFNTSTKQITSKKFQTDEEEYKQLIDQVALSQAKQFYTKQGYLNTAIRYRSVLRITFLLLFIILWIFSFYLITQYYAFYQGEIIINGNPNIYMNASNCKINFIDHISKKVYTQLGAEEMVLSESNSDQDLPNLVVQYNIPGKFGNVLDIDQDGSIVDTLADEDNNYQFHFHNMFSSQSCEINFISFKETSIDNLKFDCHSNCFILMQSVNTTFTNIEIDGDQIQMNAPIVKSTNFSFNAQSGRFQGGYMAFKEFANIKLDAGDIVVQTDKELMVNWTHSNPHYCFGSPAMVNPIVIGCQPPPESEVEAYVNGVEKGKDSDDIIKKGEENNEENVDQKFIMNGVEKYFEDNEDNLSVYLNPKFNLYGDSKELQENLSEIQSQNNYNSDLLNIHVQSKKKRTKPQTFKPSCYGAALLCYTSECASFSQAQLFNHHQHFRNLQEENEGDEGKEQDRKEQKIDYNKLREMAEAKLPHSIQEGMRFLNLTAKFGNLYVNLIEKQNATLQMSDMVIHGSSYVKGFIDFDLPSQKLLSQLIKTAKDPRNFDPIFLLQIGSKKTKSDNFQQWQITYNPAYSYIRPWWIGTFSFTLMSTSLFEAEVNLGPGFCPYMPSLDLNEVYSTQFLIEKYFEESENSLATIAWQHTVPFPKVDYAITADGVREYVGSNDEFENWIHIVKINETNYEIQKVSKDNNFAARYSVYVSVFISIALSFTLLFGVIYMVNSVYFQIVQQVSSTSKYSKIDLKKDAEQDYALLKEVMKEEEDEQEQELDEQQNSSEQVVDLNKLSKIQGLNKFHPFTLIYFLFNIAPPLSAFIDYLCVLIIKQYFTNSVKKFYSHIFDRKSVIQEQDLYNPENEYMSKSELKTYYEKFCFLNGYFEQDLMKTGNIKLLKERGFRFLKDQYTQIEVYQKVLLNGAMPKISIIPKNKTPIILFMENCCSTSNFEEDQVDADLFLEKYQEFCTLNHLEFEIPSPAILQKQYNIQNKYVPLLMVVRIEEEEEEEEEQENQERPSSLIKQYVQGYSDAIAQQIEKLKPKKEEYVLNKRKIENHFQLMMNHPQNIKTQPELKQMINKLILYGGWYIEDIFVVLAHIVSNLILILPLFSFTLLEKVLYSKYSLIPESNLITIEDITNNFWILPFQLYNESYWIKVIIMIVCVYLIYAVIDLVFYYGYMEFPQENFFKRVQYDVSPIQRFFRQVMWGLVLFSVFLFFTFIFLGIIWLILGAIVNPTAFLPYATAAGTFIVVMSTRAAQFKELATKGFNAVIECIQQIALKQMQNILLKLNVKQSVDEVIDSELFQSAAKQAVSLGLIEKETLLKMQENADKIFTDPEALKNASNELLEIVKNPQEFQQRVVEKLEEQTTNFIKTQIADQFQGVGEIIANIMLAIYKKDRNLIKTYIQELIHQDEYLAKFGTAISGFILEIAYPQETIIHDDFFDQMVQPSVVLLTELIRAEELEEESSSLDLHLLMKKAISIERNLQKDQINAFLQDLEELMGSVKDHPKFLNLKVTTTVSPIFRIALSLYQGKAKKSLKFHSITKHVQKLVKENPTLSKYQELFGMIEIILNSYNKQMRIWPAKTIQNKVDSGINKLMDLVGSSQTLKKRIPVITIIFNFIQHHFIQLPQDVVIQAMTQVKQKNNLFVSQTENESKKFARLLTSSFELVSILMEHPDELILNLHMAADSYGLETEWAKELLGLASIKHFKHTTYEGSKEEDERFQQLSSNSIVLAVSRRLRVNHRIVMGLLAHLIDLPKREELIDLYQLISIVNKTSELKVSQFFDILRLFTSQNEIHLTMACTNLFLPRRYITLLLLRKGLIKPRAVDSSWFKLMGASKEAVLILQDNEPNMDIFFTKLQEGFSEDQPDKNLKLFLLSTTETRIQIDPLQILKALENQENQLVKITQTELPILKTILSLKTINFSGSSAIFSSETNGGIQILSELLNLNRQYLEDLLTITFLQGVDKVLQSLRNLQEKDELVPKFAAHHYQDYLDYVYSRLNLVSNKQNFIITKLKKVFPQIKLPETLLTQVLFNNHQRLDIKGIYELVSSIIPMEYENQSRLSIMRQLKQPIRFLTSTLSRSKMQDIKQILGKNRLTDGMAVVIQMLNQNSRKKSVSLFLNYLLKNVDKIPEVIHLYSCLYLFFTGQHSDITVDVELTNSKEIQQITILQYLCKRLDIHPEFFEALHTFYLNDNIKFTQNMLKFMKRVQFCKQKEKFPSLNIPSQSLVSLPEQFILNFINLMTSKSYQTQFFAKELELNHEIIHFISTLMEIKNASTTKDRQRAYSNFSVQKAFFRAINVVEDELLLILNLLYQDFELSSISEMIDKFKLNNRLQVGTLTSLLQINKFNIIDLQNKKVYKQKLKDQIQENKVINSMKIDPDIAILAKSLCRGGFCSLEDLLKQVPHLDYAEGPGKHDYICLMKGLIGCISSPLPKGFQIKKFLREMHSKLASDGREYYEEGSNNMTFVYYHLARVINIHPLILMLSQGLKEAWMLLKDQYYIVESQSNNWLHPALVLELFLIFRNLPTLFFEILTNSKFVDISDQDEIIIDIICGKQLEPNQLIELGQTIPLDKEIIDTIKSSLDQLNSIRQKTFIDTLTIISDDNEIMTYLFSGVDPHTFKDIAELMKTNNSSYEQAVNQDEYLLKLKPRIQFQTLILIYQQLCQIYKDPLLKVMNKGFKKRYPYEALDIFTLGICSTLNNLRTTYWVAPKGITLGESDHYKYVAYELDYILTSIERYYFFMEFTDSYSKPKAATILGLAAGFVFSADHFIAANLKPNLYDYSDYTEIWTHNKKSEFKYKMEMKFSRLEQVQNLAKNYRHNLKIDKLKQKQIKLNMYTNPERYWNDSIQAFMVDKNSNRGFQVEQYCYDLPFILQTNPLNDFIMLERNRFNYIAYKNDFLQDRIVQNSKWQITQMQKKLQDYQQYQQQNISLTNARQSQNDYEQQFDLFQLIDPRTGRTWSEVFESQERWKYIVYQNNDNFKLLIEILKGNYISVNEENSYFSTTEPQAASAYTGILGLQGATYNINSGNISTMVRKYFDNCCWNLQSNKKYLLEILSIFFNCYDNFDGISQVFNVDSQILNSFIILSCNLAQNETEKFEHLNNLIQSLSLMRPDQEVLTSTLQAYMGDINQYYQLASYSQLIQKQAQQQEEKRINTKTQNISPSFVIPDNIDQNLIRAQNNARYNQQIKPQESNQQSQQNIAPQKQVITQQDQQQNQIPSNIQQQEQDKQFTAIQGQNAQNDNRNSQAGFNQLSPQQQQMNEIDLQENFEYIQREIIEYDQNGQPHTVIVREPVIRQTQVQKTVINYDENGNPYEEKILEQVEFVERRILEYDENGNPREIIIQEPVIVFKKLEQQPPQYVYVNDRVEPIQQQPQRLSQPIFDQQQYLSQQPRYTKEKIQREFLQTVQPRKEQKQSQFESMPRERIEQPKKSAVPISRSIQQGEKKEHSKFSMARKMPQQTEINLSIERTLKKLLYSFDMSQIHTQGQINPSIYNFSENYSLSLNPTMKEQDFLIMLWQLSQAVTIDSLPGYLKIPGVFPQSIFENAENDEVSLVHSSRLRSTFNFKQNLSQFFHSAVNKVSEPEDKTIQDKFNFILSYMLFINQLTKEDYSFFFLAKQSFVYNLLFRIYVAEGIEDLELLKTVISLKPNIIQVIKLKINRQDQNYFIDTKALVDNLIQFGIISISDDAGKRQELLSYNIARLFIGISTNNIPEIVESLNQHDHMKAGLLLSLYLWKNLTHVFDIFQDSYSKISNLLSAIQLLPLLVLSQINEDQDREKTAFGSTIHSQMGVRKQIISETREIIDLISNAISDPIFNYVISQIEEQAQLSRQQKQSFLWVQWINKIPEFEKEVFSQQKLRLQNKTALIFRMITGYEFYKLVQNEEHIGQLLVLYTQVLNLKEDVLVSRKYKNTNQSISSVIPNLLNVQKNNTKNFEILSIYDDLIKLLFFLQINQNQLCPLQQVYLKQKEMIVIRKRVQMNLKNFYLQGGDMDQSFREDNESQIINQPMKNNMNQSIHNSNQEEDESYYFESDSENRRGSMIEIKKNLENTVVDNQSEEEFNLYIYNYLFVLINQINKLDRDIYNQAQNLRKLQNGIISILTGYNRYGQVSKREKLNILYYILDLYFFIPLGIIDLFNSELIRDINVCLQGIKNQPYKSIKNREFINQIVILMCAITNTDINEGQSNQLKNIRQSKLSNVKNQSPMQMQKEKDQVWIVNLPPRRKLVTLPLNFIHIILNLSSGKIEYVPYLLREMKMSERQVQIVETIINQVQELNVFGKKDPQLALTNKTDEKLDVNLALMIEKIKDGTMTNEDLFRVIDEDQTESISKVEYGNLARRLGIKLSEHRINEIFANIKMSQKFSLNDEELNQKEFARGMEYLQEKNRTITLENLGISQGLLTVALIYLAFILLLLFTFIFLGIQAFTLGGVFGAIINSIIPMVAGTGASQRVDQPKFEDKHDTTIQDSIEETQKIIQLDEE